MINYPADLAICWWWRRLFRIFPQWDNWRVKYIWLRQSLPNIYKCLVLWDHSLSCSIWYENISLKSVLHGKYFTQGIQIYIFPCFCGLFQPEESTFLFMFEFEKSNKLWTSLCTAWLRAAGYSRDVPDCYYYYLLFIFPPILPENLISITSLPGPAGGGGAPPGHVPQPGQHREEAGQRAGQPGGRHAAPQEAGGDEHQVELPQGQEHGHQVGP